MEKTSKITALLLISDSSTIAQTIQSALAAEPGYKFIGKVQLKAHIIEVIRESQPDIILFHADFDDGQCLKVIDEITSQYNAGSVVAILPKAKVHLSDQVILAGARAILLDPFPNENLLNTLHRMQELKSRQGGAGQESKTAPLKTNPNHSFVVFSPKGGVGSTTVAINLSIALHQQLREKVLLVDGKPVLGHVALMLNLRSGNSILDLLANAEKLDEGLINQVVLNHVSGVSVLPSPPILSQVADIQPETLYKVILELKKLYPTMIIDGGNHLDDNLVTYMDSADYILLIVNPNLASIRDARQFLDISHSMLYSKDRTFVILNQADSKAGIKLGDIEKALHTKIIGTIPADRDIALNSVNEGIPIILAKPNHPISKAVKTVSKALVEIIQSTSKSIDSKSRIPLDVLHKSSYRG